MVVRMSTGAGVKTATLGQIGGVPVLILKEGTSRTVGKEALRANIMAARAIAEILRSSLGPKGMDKMLVDSLGDITITNDGATILKEMDVQHPAAKMMVEISKAQDNEVGDGTTTAVVLAGELLKQAEELLDKNIHTSIINSGYKKAAQKAEEVLQRIAIPVDINDEELLKKVAMTAMSGKVVSVAAEHLAKIAVKAVRQIVEEHNNKLVADVDQIQIIKRKGGSVFDTTLIYGVVLDKEVVHPGMPKRVEKAKITLLDCPLEVEKTEIDAEIRISDPEQMRAFLEEEERILKRMVDKIKSVGANVVFCQKGIDDVAQHFLAKYGILAARRIKKSDIEKLARATGARIVTSIDDLTEKDLGYAELVEQRKIAEEKMIFVEGCKNPKSVSILVRGGLERFVDEAERSLRDALYVVADVIKEPKVLAGGGAPEVEVAKELRGYASSIGGREQLAIEAFANAIEVIPSTLAENAGLDPIDIITELRALHTDPKNVWYGIDVYEGKPADMLSKNVLEPLLVKVNAIKTAVEEAAFILRIDDIIAASKTEVGKEKGKAPLEEKSESEIE
ncbi:MAG: thermosome subunit beta [Candidatus Methanomethylicia archaeon]|nr:thermosome subunit beta [Candidatus Methanomethylicia archaeon]MCX8169104.1 thermosome subunit beta [Candidatus Methanomethylicia archaeon]MDW7988836.1 thermosome subunit beta [Nitrososphaerota archaeon]